jgi:hypothetical protein
MVSVGSSTLYLLGPLQSILLVGHHILYVIHGAFYMESLGPSKLCL